MNPAGAWYEAEAVKIVIRRALAITSEALCIQADFSVPNLVFKASELVVDFSKAVTIAGVRSRRIAIEVEVTPRRESRRILIAPAGTVFESSAIVADGSQ